MSENNPWKYAKPRDVSNNPFAKEKKEDTPKGDNFNSQNLDKNGWYTLLQAWSYSDRMNNLRTHLQNDPSNVHPEFKLPDGSKVYRPLTFKENIEIRVNEYNREYNPDGSKQTDKQKIMFFNVYIDSCSGVASKKKEVNDSGRSFKIIPICSDLITISKNYRESSLPIDYQSIQGIELKTDGDNYNSPLTLDLVLKHPAWLASLDGDKTLLKEYAQITFDILSKKYNKKDGMGYWIPLNPIRDKLQSLFVGPLEGNSDANGLEYLTTSAGFLIIEPKDGGSA